MKHEMTVTIEGTTPLLLGNGIAADPLDPRVKLRAPLKKKSQKTDADHKELARIDWDLALYLNKDGAIILPAPNFNASIIEGARGFKKGKKAAAGVVVVNDAPLDFPDKRKSLDALYEMGRYTYRRMISSSRGRVACVSPRFDEWRATFQILFDDEVCDAQTLRDWIMKGGRESGVGAFRRYFGKYRLVE